MDKIQEMLIKMLKKCKFFQDLDNDKLVEFANLFKLDMAQENQAIIIEWHNVEYIYILKKWILQAKKADGLKSIILWNVQEWETFWEMSFFYKQPAMASVVCISPTANFWKISREDFEKFLEKNQEVKIKIWKLIKKREEENKEKIWWKVSNPNLNKKNENADDIKINL